MAAIWLTARAEWRQRWRSVIVLSALAGLAGSVVLAAFTGSRRADTAFVRLLEYQKPPTVFVETETRPDPERVRAVARSPGVEWAAHDVFLAVAPAGSAMLPGHDTIAFTQPLVAGADPPAFPIVEGRPYDERRPDELVVNEAMRDALDLEIGDRLVLVSFTPGQSKASDAEGRRVSPGGPTQEVRLVGVARGAEDVSDAPDPFLFVTPAYYERHGAAIGGGQGVSLRVDEDHLPELEARVHSLFGDDAAIGEPEDPGVGIEGALAVEVNGLRAFALAAALAGIAALAQAFVRQAQIMSEEDPVRRALGMTSHQLVLSGVVAASPIATAGALLAGAGGVAGGPLAITGVARQAEPDPGPWFDPLVLPGAIVVGLVVLAIAAGASRLAGAPRPAVRQAPARPSRATGVLAALPPSMAVGVRMALDTGRGRSAPPARLALAGAAAGVAGVVATLAFGARVDHLLATPELWGANYDAIVTTGGDLSLHQTTAEKIARRPDVEAVAVFEGLDLAVHAQDRRSTVGANALWDHSGDIAPVIPEGRGPAAADEVAVGQEVLDRLGVDIGDTLEVEGDGNGQALRVVGSYVQAGENDPGSGALLTPEGFTTLEGEDRDSGVLVRFARDVDSDAALARLRELGDQVEVTRAGDAMPSNIDNVDELGALPAVLAAFLALLATVAAAHALVSTTRRRRRDFAVLRVLGFVGRQARRTMRWQALTVAAVGLLVGVPVGIVAGRRLWSALAQAIGVVDDWSLPWLMVALAVAVTVGVAVLLAIPPGRMATRVPPGRVLRAE
ncbi:MAG: ABC transporter permease [Acidimicrobiales bacterium]